VPKENVEFGVYGKSPDLTEKSAKLRLKNSGLKTRKNCP